MKIRVPGWARGQAMPSSLYAFKNWNGPHISIRINGKEVDYKIENGYAVLDRVWNNADQVTMDLPMPAEQVAAIRLVPEDSGKLAIQRGPLIYCAEWKDNDGKVSDFVLPDRSVLEPAKRPALLGGITILTGQVLRRNGPTERTRIAQMTMIPYYAWANRGKGEMTIWLPGTQHFP